MPAGFWAATANALWGSSLLRDAVAFARARAVPEEAQTQLLRAVMRQAAGSAIGRSADLARVRHLDDLPHALPLGDHASHRPYFERVEAGEPNVLGTEPVHVLEPTSGSTGGAKLIPTTAGVRRAFARGVAPWVADLFRRDRALMAGSAYWSLSPSLQRQRHTAGGVRIGFDDDTAYLGRLGAALARVVLAVPAQVRTLQDLSSFRHATLLHLIARPDLRLVSVWNPSFFTLLLDALPEHGAQLVDDLRRGACRPPSGPPIPTLARASDATAATRLQAALRGDPDDLGRTLWPHLRLVSCWCDAAAARPAQELAQRLPHARMQGKGLVATEAFVTLPLIGAPAPVLALRSHVFEFLDASGETRFAHQVEDGETYEVVVTTGVLYRYRLGDLVRVVGHHGRAPMLRFLGRAGAVSDLVGEKLHEPHVRATIDRACTAHALRPRFALLAANREVRPPAYHLYIEGVATADLDRVRDAIERGLADNPHYAYARALGQLGPVRIVPVTNGAARFEAAAAARGQRRGDVKPTALSAVGDEHEALTAELA